MNTTNVLTVSYGTLSWTLEGFDDPFEMVNLTRPKLMGTLRYEDPEQFSRERGLQTFDHFLKAVKLSRLEGGFFVISEEIGYQIEEWKVG